MELVIVHAPYLCILQLEVGDNRLVRNKVHIHVHLDIEIHGVHGV